MQHQIKKVIWTPDYDQAGTYYVHVVATDNGDGTGSPAVSELTVPIFVANANRAPVIGAVSNAFVNKNATLDIPVSATDIDGNPVTLTISGLPSFASYVQTSAPGAATASGYIHFAPTDGQRGDYTITVTAQDNGDPRDGSAIAPNQVLAEAKSFVVTVRSASEAPVISMPRQIVALAGTPISVPIYVRDQDQDALTFSANDLPPGATITPLPQYGQALLTWTPTEDDVRVHDIEIVVTDSGLPPQDAGYIVDPANPPVPNVRSQVLRVVVRSAGANAAPTLLGVTLQAISVLPGRRGGR